MLVLPIKKKWFDMIASGKKKEEYREIKPYYDKCLGNECIGFPFIQEIIDNFESIKEYDPAQIKELEIVFRNGYRADSPKIKCKCKLKIGQGKKEWGAEPGKEYYILEIIKIIEIQNWNNPNPIGSIPRIPIMNNAMAAAVEQATHEAQDEIEKAINKQLGMGINAEEALNKVTQEMKNRMMFGI